MEDTPTSPARGPGGLWPYATLYQTRALREHRRGPSRHSDLRSCHRPSLSPRKTASTQLEETLCEEASRHRHRNLDLGGARAWAPTNASKRGPHPITLETRKEPMLPALRGFCRPWFPKRTVPPLQQPNEELPLLSEHCRLPWLRDSRSKEESPQDSPDLTTHQPTLSAAGRHIYQRPIPSSSIALI